MSDNPFANTPWLDPRFESESKFVKFTQPGDTVIGVLRAWSEDCFPADGDKPERPYAVMHLDTANGEKELGLTLMDMRDQMFKAQPAIGDTVSVRYLRDGKPKLFHVEVTRAVQGPTPEEVAAYVKGAGPIVPPPTQYGQPGPAGYGPPSQEQAPF